MKRHEPRTQRALISLAAAAMTILTIGVLVVGPAEMSGDDNAAMSIARAVPSTAPATEVVISPAQIEVIAVRTQATALERLRSFVDRRKRDS